MSYIDTINEQTRPRNGSAQNTGRFAHVVGWGVEVPEKVLTNFDLEEMVETSDEWIRERTGISERRIADDRDSTMTLALRAARKALSQADVSPRDLDLIIVATSTPLYLFPSTACLIQDKLGATRAGAFDLMAACTGFIYGLGMAAAQIRIGMIEHALVIGAETLSRIVDWSDRSTCVLFGDGAGAFVLSASDDPGGIIDYVLHSDGSGGDYLVASSGVKQTWNGNPHQQSLTMNGREVYRFASRVMTQGTQEVLGMAGLKVDDIDLIIPHQANIRIIQSAARGLKLPMDRFYVNIDRYGNTSAASIPLAIADAVEDRRLKPNDKIVLVAFGAGLTWGALVMDWAVEPTPRSHLREAFRESWYILASIRSLLRRLWRVIEAIFWRHDKSKHLESGRSDNGQPES
ncbi:MAG: ketoacyl-ACP synthase III [Anaerolineae bacterium]|nr:ketoacyl-ACP synthase III [Anaerolineae bacterium]